MITRARAAVAASAIVLLVAGVTTACTAQTPAPVGTGGTGTLPDAAVEVMNQPQYANGRWYISVRDIDTGEVLIDLDGDKMAEPGSFAKTYSVGAGWLEWGPDHTITTPVKRTGEVVAGALQGDLVLVGKGDITMGGRTKADGTVDYTNFDHNDANALPGATLTPEDPLAGLDELAAQVKASGIDRVTGDVLIDDRLFQGELAGQPITPIVINQNVIDVTITPGAVGEPATLELSPAVAPWTITGTVETVAAGEDNVLRGGPSLSGDGQLTFSGSIAADSDPQVKIYTLEDPATFARTAFIEALARAGVAVDVDPLAANTTATLADQGAVDALPSVAELQSLTYEQDATYVMKISYNRGAQTIICLLAVEAGDAGDNCLAGMQRAGTTWKDAGLDVLGASLVDGSGLPGNLITPDNAVQIQTLMAERDDAERWKQTLPILGVDGSLTEVQKDSPAAGKVFAKTGTLLNYDQFNDRFEVTTKTLGGLIESAEGRNLAFTIMVNHGFYPQPEGALEANEDVGAIAAAIQQAF